MSLQFKHPFNMICAGPSGCGKTWFVKKIIENMSELINTQISEVVWCYSQWQNLYETLPHVKFKEGIPKLEEFSHDGTTRLVIIDDLMSEVDKSVADLFTKGSHHNNLSVVYITQNLFCQGRGQRDISLNAHYIVCFRNPRDPAQFMHLSRQVCPRNTKFLQEAYSDATRAPHGYLLLDFKQCTPETCRFRSNIFPHDDEPCVYVDKSSIKQGCTGEILSL